MASVSGVSGDSCCSGCKWKEYELVSVAYHNEERAQHIFREHGILPSGVTCPLCNKKCTFYEDRGLWRCTFSSRVPKQKKWRSCSFSISDKKGTLLEGSHISAWQILLFINLFVRKQWCHSTAIQNLDISLKTSVDWRILCSEVCENWLDHQEPIGGQGKVVEISETFFVNRKLNQSRKPSGVWLLGGIERDSDKKFVVPISGPPSSDVQRQDGGALIPIIQKHVLAGTIIHTDSGAAYRRLTEFGFQHYTVGHKENSVSPTDQEVRTQKIKRLWRDVKEWCARPGSKAEYAHQYLARYVFVNSVPPEERVHHFLQAARKIYPHHSQPRNNN